MFCEKCGTKLESNKCSNCGFEKFVNPIPVVVGLVPVVDTENSKVYLLGVRRNIEPKKGEIVLPGGFLEVEEMIEGLKRELWEEAKVQIEVEPNSPVLAFSTEPTPNRVLIFIKTIPLKKEEVDFSFKNEETQELFLIDESTPIGFPLHKKAVDYFFNEFKNKKENDHNCCMRGR